MSNNVFDDPQLTAYGNASVESLSPITQIKARYGLLTNVLTVIDSGGAGIVSAVDNKFTCDSGTTSDGLASILTLRQVSPRAGQGALARLSIIFDTPVVDNNQVGGLITAENLFTFAYLGTSFGILSIRDGLDELQELTLTVAAGAETAVVTVDGTAYNIPLAGLGTVQEDAFELALELNVQVPNYNFSSNDNQVVAQAVIPGPGGSFAYTSPGTSVGSWTQITLGANGATAFVPQADWNFNTRISPNTDINLDPQDNNYYKIQINGSADFFVQDRISKKDILVHRMSFVNIDALSNPAEETFRVGWVCRNVGNNSSVVMQGSYAASFIEGEIYYDTTPQGLSVDQNVSAGTGQHSLIILRNRQSFGGKVNRAEVLPLIVNVSSQTNKFVFFKILLNPTFATPVTFQYADKENSLIEISTQDIIITGGLEIGSATVTDGAPRLLEFNNTKIRTLAAFPGSTIAIVAEIPSGTAADCQVNLQLQQDL